MPSVQAPERRRGLIGLSSGNGVSRQTGKNVPFNVVNAYWVPLPIPTFTPTGDMRPVLPRVTFYR